MRVGVGEPTGVPPPGSAAAAVAEPMEAAAAVAASSVAAWPAATVVADPDTPEGRRSDAGLDRREANEVVHSGRATATLSLKTENHPKKALSPSGHSNLNCPSSETIWMKVTKETPPFVGVPTHVPPHV